MIFCIVSSVDLLQILHKASTAGRSTTKTVYIKEVVIERSKDDNVHETAV